MRSAPKPASQPASHRLPLFWTDLTHTLSSPLCVKISTLSDFFFAEERVRILAEQKEAQQRQGTAAAAQNQKKVCDDIDTVAACSVDGDGGASVQLCPGCSGRIVPSSTPAASRSATTTSSARSICSSSTSSAAGSAARYVSSSSSASLGENSSNISGSSSSSNASPSGTDDDDDDNNDND